MPELCNGLDDDCDGQVDEGGDPGSSACPCQREERDGSTYQFCPEKLGWGIAVARCAARGYHLVKIDDDPENDWLYARGESALQSEPWWAGLSDIAAEGTWVWVDLAPVAYQKWDLGSDEPNGGTEENCLDLSHHSDGRWNDADCALVQPFVCELGPP